MFSPVFVLGIALTVLMAIDCVANRREPFWLLVLVCLLPFWGVGGLVYAVYNYRSITFPFPVARMMDGMTFGRASKRCPRCFRSVSRLDPYEDGRATRYICPMCKAEMEILRADRLKLD